MEDALPTTEDSSAPDPDSAESDTGEPIETACAQALPGPIDLKHPVGEDEFADFVLESPDWALGLIHAQGQLEQLAQDRGGPALNPSWFLALSLNSTVMDCTQPGGCYAFSETNHWALLCELYGDLDCTEQSMETLVGLGPEGESRAGAATLAMAWHAALSYALLPTSGFGDPAAWLADASDPQALEKILTLSTIDSAWSPVLAQIADDCQSLPIEDCIEEDRAWVRDQVISVAAHAAELDQAVADEHCLELELSSEDVDAYGAQLEGLFPALPWSKAMKLVELNDGVDLLTAAAGVLDALDQGSGLQLDCPDQALQEGYDTECPS
jgi:hypothetical protein